MADIRYEEAFAAVRKGTQTPSQLNDVQVAAKGVGRLGDEARNALDHAGEDRDKQHHSRFW